MFTCAGLVAFQKTLVNVDLTKEACVASAANALVFVLDLVNNAVGIVLAQTDRTNRRHIILGHAMLNFRVEERA